MKKVKKRGYVSKEWQNTDVHYWRISMSVYWLLFTCFCYTYQIM